MVPDIGVNLLSRTYCLALSRPVRAGPTASAPRMGALSVVPSAQSVQTPTLPPGKRARTLPSPSGGGQMDLPETHRVGDHSPQDAAADYGCEELLELALVGCEREDEPDHAAVHSPEDDLLRPWPEALGAAACLLDPSEQRVRHDADEHRVIEGEDQPQGDQLEARVDLGHDARDQPDQQGEVQDQIGNDQPEVAVAGQGQTIAPPELRRQPHGIDDDGSELGRNERA